MNENIKIYFSIGYILLIAISVIIALNWEKNRSNNQEKPPTYVIISYIFLFINILLVFIGIFVR